jgi:hypothetical protein
MHGMDKVFLLCGPTPDEVALNKNAIDAAQGGGVELLVRLSPAARRNRPTIRPSARPRCVSRLSQNRKL